ncbi:FAD-dependent oxidoreductase [Bailinhaonella thermotolerans]|uniref:FAD-dependent oxidoreductase n=1 Tax=Bailinhaonella thermotolerans TaxID=1070861 RepID=A0A3A4APP8_9ACTN|nr:FAD-dependent oxidoreductase [Bailinhaonella thermotolerans]RJL31646.1 FAD-dependent oxidoreductase [Bailinhaonella thermotolerans]
MGRIETTTVAIAGGGPAGAMLALQLARAGVEVVLLEKHADFLRDFRGDTIHPSTLQVLDELGLAEEFHRIPHRKTRRISVYTDEGIQPFAGLENIPGKYKYVAFVPQWDFLNMITENAKRYPTFKLVMRAEAYDVIREGQAVRGLRYRDAEGEHELRATLTVAADGRDSRIRRMAALVPTDIGAPMDVVWFRVDRGEGDPPDSFLRISSGYMMAAINRESYWQFAYIIPKGAAGELREAGVEAFRDRVRGLLPFLGDRVGQVRAWDDTSVLRVQVNRLRRWHREGLLCIGDAAHAMSPVFGVGINLAVQDAVAAANALAGPLRRGGPVPRSVLARIQRRRMPPTVITQEAQRFVQNQVIKRVFEGDTPPPAVFRLIPRVPLVRDLIPLFVGHGVLPEHVRTPEALTPAPVAQRA